MNFVRNAFASTLVLALSLSVGGCDKTKPDGTTPPTTGGDTAATGGAGDSGAATGGDTGGAATDGGDSGGDTGEKPPVAKNCEAKTADAPAALFNESVLIRPPLNVELVEDNPFLAVAVVSGGFVSACEATVDEMRVMVFENDKKKSAKVFAEELLANLEKGGYTGGTKSAAYMDTNDEYELSIEFPASGGAPASVLYIAIRRRHANFFALVYKTRPGEFPTLKPTFAKSASTLLVKKPS